MKLYTSLLSKLLNINAKMKKSHAMIMNTADPIAISTAKELLSRGCVIALPTDTIVNITMNPKVELLITADISVWPRLRCK